MFGYASDETADCMPLIHSMATRLGKTLTDVRKSGECWWLRPDGKTQVNIEYLKHPDGSVEPKKIHTVVISTQHAELLKAVRSKECGGYKGAEIKRTLEQIKLKNGQPAIRLCGSLPSDARLTGRKVIINTSVAYVLTVVVRSPARALPRWTDPQPTFASARCLVQLSYAIGVAKPLSLFVETFGSEKTGLTVNDITSILKRLGCLNVCLRQSKSRRS